MPQFYGHIFESTMNLSFVLIGITMDYIQYWLYDTIHHFFLKRNAYLASWSFNTLTVLFENNFVMNAYLNIYDIYSYMSQQMIYLFSYSGVD